MQKEEWVRGANGAPPRADSALIAGPAWGHRRLRAAVRGVPACGCLSCELR